MVGAAERLIFEGGPILEPPIEQDRESSRPGRPPSGGKSSASVG
jgi:hypothetical protein